MAKKNLEVRDPIATLEEVADPVSAASTVCGDEYRVIGRGAWTPAGKQLAIGTIFMPVEIGMSQAQVVEMVRAHDIELAAKNVTKPFNQELVTKGAVDNGGSANC